RKPRARAAPRRRASSCSPRAGWRCSTTPRNRLNWRSSPRAVTRRRSAPPTASSAAPNNRRASPLPLSPESPSPRKELPMHRRLLVVAFAVLFAAPLLHASCGSASCPLETSALFLPFARGFTLDLSLQSIDQDQPRIGTRAAHPGEIAGPDHDEVRTVNRIATALLTYAPTSRLHLSASIPYVSRDHDHLASTVPESWHLDGVGDMVLQARAKVAGRVWVIGGVKLPTGEHELRNDDGEVAELPVQPGSGTTDGIAGVSYQGRWFFTATYQFRTGAADGYRLGNELQLSTGSVHAFTPRLDLLLQ